MVRTYVRYGGGCVVPPLEDLKDRPDIAPDDISGAIRFLQQEYLRANRWSRPSQINEGNCDYFASDIVELIPEAHLQCSDDKPEYHSTDWAVGHCWVEFAGRYYDAEAPEGVDDWYDLPIFVRERGRGRR